MKKICDLSVIEIYLKCKSWSEVELVKLMLVFEKTENTSQNQSPSVSLERRTLSDREKRSIQRGQLFIDCFKKAVSEDIESKSQS